MRQILLALVAVVGLSVLAAEGSAAEKAATKTLPAALQQLPGGAGQLVTVEEARQVRGECLYIYINGWVQTSNFSGSVLVQGYAQYINFYVSPYVFSLVAY